MTIVRRRKKSTVDQLLDFIRDELIQADAKEKTGIAVEISFYARNGGISNVKYSRHEKLELQ